MPILPTLPDGVQVLGMREGRKEGKDDNYVMEKGWLELEGASDETGKMEKIEESKNTEKSNIELKQEWEKRRNERSIRRKKILKHARN